MNACVSKCRIVSLVALAVAWGGAQAQGRPLDDDALSGVWGQAMFSLTNQSLVDSTTNTTYDFSRITLNANVLLNANLGGVRLGEYTYAPNNGTGADIDIPVIQFGRTDATTAQRTVSITDPYVEFVYTGTGTNRQVVGMRLGFGSIAGDIGLQMNSVSGSLLINTPSGTVDATGKRIDTATCTTGSCQVALSQLGGVTAGDASGPSKDFFLSVLKQAVTYPTVNGMSSPEAMAGFWMNWRDKLTALASLPANNATK
jgi:hypothetical protein